jgi:hypothetical protein
MGDTEEWCDGLGGWHFARSGTSTTLSDQVIGTSTTLSGQVDWHFDRSGGPLRSVARLIGLLVDFEF